MKDTKENKSKRKSIPETVKLQLWVKSGGRCEFKGCNKPLWRNNLTLSDGNFAEFAHIIGSSKDGPRGTEESEKLQIEFSNLMFVCQSCHKEIDEDPTKYTAELLRRWKEEHESRIERQTEHPDEIHQSTILQCSINIGDRIVPINIEAMKNAMFPKYPIDLKGIKIEERTFDRNSTPEVWQQFAETKIKRKIQRSLEEGIDDAKIKHLSIFGLAPIPLLMYLGKCVGDTIPAEIYQSHRNIDETSKTWNWRESNVFPQYHAKFEHEANGDKVLLKIAISDYLAPDKYSSLADSNDSIYCLTVDEPSVHFLQSKKQLEHFSYEYRKLLNDIQEKHGRNCVIYLLPAMPAALAIECGRIILPTKDPQIYACEYLKEKGGFIPVLKINE